MMGATYSAGPWSSRFRIRYAFLLFPPRAGRGRALLACLFPLASVVPYQNANQERDGNDDEDDGEDRAPR